MPVDFRYHVISLVAVFCALVIGVLVGFSMGASPEMEEKVTALRQLFDEDIKELTSQVETQNQFIKGITPWVLRERLAGRRIAIVLARSTRDSKRSAEAIEALRDAIGKAGGQVDCVVQIRGRFYLLSDPKYERTRSAVGEALTVGASDLEAVPRLVAARLAENLVLGTLGTERAEQLERAKVVKFVDPCTRGADSLVLVGGLRDEDDTPLQMLDLPVIAKCEEFRVPIRVIACEMSDAPVSAIARYKQAKATATVDNIDTPYGRAAAVLALQGKPGHFGTKDTADSLFPSIDVE